MSVSQIDPKLLMGQIPPRCCSATWPKRLELSFSFKKIREYQTLWLWSILEFYKSSENICIPFSELAQKIIFESWITVWCWPSLVAKLKICHFSPQHQWRHRCSARKRSNWHKSALKCIFVFCNWENLVNKTFWRAKCPSGQLAHHKSLLLKILEALLFATISATSLSAS